jgi:hypothetical protein
MQFKHPEILYFLFLLIIPILVHLFQLRRFKKEYFTNVQFLKELSIQTRKSSKLKKWLLLCTRLLLLTFLILAFAQPFFTAKESKKATNEMYIILDNSFSMQAKGKKGEFTLIYMLWSDSYHSGVLSRRTITSLLIISFMNYFIAT